MTVKAPRTHDLDRIDEPLVDSLLTHDELSIRQRLREVVAEHVIPRAGQVDRDKQFAEESFRVVAPYCGVMFPREYGGHDGSTVAYAIATEEITRACPSTSLIWVTQVHAAYPILVAGSAEQRQRYLPGLCDGTLYGSLAITEPDAGSDSASIRTTARRDGHDYLVNGTKTFITTGDRADVIVCFTRVGPGGGRDTITALLIPGDAAGIDSRIIHKLGMHGSSTAEVFLDAVRVHGSARLGEEGDGWRISQRTVVKSRISAAAQGLGIAAAAYDLGLRWANDHGVLRGSAHQVIQFRLADLRTRILMARLQLHAVARSIDAGRGEESTAEIAMAKFTCTDLGFDAASAVVSLLGPDGALQATGAERLLRDCKVTQIYDGTNEIQHLLIARDTLTKMESPR